MIYHNTAKAYNPWQKEVDIAVKRFGRTNTSLLSALESIQDTMNHIPEEAARYLSGIYSLPLANIYSVLSFYGILTTEKKGKYVIRVCDSLSCHINQPDNLLKLIWGILNIRPGETTQDKKFSLEIVDCLGLCDQAPAMMVNNNVYGKLNTSGLMKILNELQEKG